SELFEKNNITNINKFFGHSNDFSMDNLNQKASYSPITGEWYSIQSSKSEKNEDILVWLTNVTDRKEYDRNLKTIREFNNNVINSLDDLVVNNDIFVRLAELIFNYHFKTIVIMQVKEDILDGFKFKSSSTGVISAEPIILSLDSLAPVLRSRRVSKVISAKASDFISQKEFENAYPFDPDVKTFIGDPVSNFINYHSGRLSIIAFNKDREITNQDHLSMEAFVNTAMVTHSLVELAIKNDKKFMQSIDGLCASAEFSDEMTGKHLQRVNKFSEIVAGLYGMDKKFCKAIGQVASVHDIGKVAIPHIIKLERKLSKEEILEMNMHPIYGAQILGRMMSNSSREYKFEMAYRIALNHHQMWNGEGYPSIINKDGDIVDLTSRHFADYSLFNPPVGTEIPLEALFVSLADKYDALRSPRHYKTAFTHEKTIGILQKDDRSGVLGEDVFGERIMQLFIENHLMFNDIYESMKD
ncbi:MAG: HD domain-containing protein, partial [Spirochaetia bacterium]|nr:HD domain-containing protein [Spirochaetia bacterium]